MKKLRNKIADQGLFLLCLGCFSLFCFEFNMNNTLWIIPLIVSYYGALLLLMMIFIELLAQIGFSISSQLSNPSTLSISF